MLRDVLDPVCIPPDEPPDDILIRSFYCLCVSLERAFSPANCAILRFDAHEEPARRYAEDLTCPCSVMQRCMEGLRTSILLMVLAMLLPFMQLIVTASQGYILRLGAMYAERTVALPGQLHLSRYVRPAYRLRTLRRSPVYTRRRGCSYVGHVG